MRERGREGVMAYQKRRPNATTTSAITQMVLIVCGVSFIFVQVRMLFLGTACSDRVKVLMESERKWAKEARDLRINLTILSKEALELEEKLATAQENYRRTSRELAASERALDLRKGELAAAKRTVEQPKDAAQAAQQSVKSVEAEALLRKHLRARGAATGEGGGGAAGEAAAGGGGGVGGAGGREEAPSQSSSSPSLSQTPKSSESLSSSPLPTAHVPRVTRIEMRPQDAVAAVVVMACNRANYLRRTIKSIREQHSSPSKFPLFISQDGSNAEVHEVASKSKHFTYLQHIEESPPVLNSPGENIAYYRIANHYKFALSHLFDTLNFQRVIILEDDMELATDFFDFFEATSELLDVDESILAVSSWNDNGQRQFVSDPEALYRSDFFPGLGWMLKKQLWDELKPKWPKAYWDDWLRLPENRKGRQSIRPEICRTYNFGEVGSSQGQFFRDFLAPIKLNDVKVDWPNKDLSHLLDVTYPDYFASGIKAVKRITSANELTASPTLEEDVIVEYEDQRSFELVAQTLGVFQEWKAGVPRTAYKGIVTIRYKGPHVVYLLNRQAAAELKLKLPLRSVA